MSCLNRIEDAVAQLRPTASVTSLRFDKHRESPIVVEAVRPSKPTVPLTVNVLHGVVVATPTLPVVELTTRTSVPEPFWIRTAVVEEIFCWNPPAAVKNESRVLPEE